MTFKDSYSIQYKTKVVDVTSVNLPGELLYHSGPDDAGWMLIEKQWGGEDKVYNLEEYLEKFKGRRVRILIEELDYAPDDAHLLPNEEEEDGRMG